MTDPSSRIPRGRTPEICHCDALVVGGGPAGLAAGIALRQRGLEVIVADALTPPIDKACGEGLLPDSRRELARLGVDLGASSMVGREFSGICFASPGRGGETLATAEFAGGRRGMGISRVELHRLLVERAVRIGVRLEWGCRVGLPVGKQRGGRATVGGRTVDYGYLVGADGEASQVRRWAGLDAGSPRSTRFGFRRHYRMAPWSDCVEVHWGDLGQIYVTPVGEDEVCLAAITRHRAMNFDRVLESVPGLSARLGGSAALGRDRGGVTTTRRLRRVTRGNIALLGDASGSADAITGSGLASSFSQAMLLADALGRGSLAQYEAGHARILRLPQTMAAVLMAMDRWPGLRERAIRTMAREPECFARMLAVHAGEQSLGRFLATGGIQLAWRLLLPRSGDNSSMSSASQRGAAAGRVELASGETTGL